MIRIMSCTNPKMGILRINEDGSRKLLFKSSLIGSMSYAQAQHLYGSDKVVLVPCGKCPSCQMSKRREWAVRCACESKYHLYNCFVTLTYDEEHCPRFLRKSDLQEFFKKLRNKGYKFRYFACGEYGSEAHSHRPHYHVCLFGFMPSDMKYFGKSKSGQAMYESMELSDLWAKGFVVVNHFDPAAAGYVAGYTTKKIGDREGFIIMSKRPGIGYQYANDKMDSLVTYDVITDSLGGYHISNVPRYFSKLAEKKDIDLTQIKAKRVEKSHSALMDVITSHGLKSYEEGFQFGREDAKNRFERLKRGL